MLEPRLEPEVNEWKEYRMPEMINDKIFEICEDISNRGSDTRFTRMFYLLYEHIEDNLEKFMPELENSDD